MVKPPIVSTSASRAKARRCSSISSRALNTLGKAGICEDRALLSNQLFDRYFISAAMAAVFSDSGLVQGMLDFEAALARAEARVGLIPQSAVAPIEAACRAERYDFAELAEAIALAGNSAIPLVKALGRQVAAVDPQAERYVHLGATSQDAMDTGLVLQLRQACALL